MEDINLEEIAKVARRCWKGYEPVPGKKPYSEDSCRPKSGTKGKDAKNKKPDGDGDGVPPWADKDDNDPNVGAKTSKKKKYSTYKKKAAIANALAKLDRLPRYNRFNQNI